MQRRFMSGITAGMLIGAAAGMMLTPQLDRNTKKRIKRSSKVMKGVAEDAYRGMVHWMK